MDINKEETVKNKETCINHRTEYNQIFYVLFSFVTTFSITPFYLR